MVLSTGDIFPTVLRRHCTTFMSIADLLKTLFLFSDMTFARQQVSPAVVLTMMTVPFQQLEKEWENISRRFSGGRHALSGFYFQLGLSLEVFISRISANDLDAAMAFEGLSDYAVNHDGLIFMHELKRRSLPVAYPKLPSVNSSTSTVSWRPRNAPICSTLSVIKYAAMWWRVPRIVISPLWS